MMITRLCYIDQIDGLQGQELLGGLNYACQIAKSKNKAVTFAVNSIKTADHFLMMMFDQKVANKLSRGEIYQHNDVSVRLRSPDSIKEYDDYGIIYGIHASEVMISKIESNKNLDTVIIFSEPTPHISKW